MQLCTRESPCFKVDCMCKFHDSIPGYVLPKVELYIGEDLEFSLPSLSLTQNYKRPVVFSDPGLLLTAKDIVLRKCHQTEPYQFQECYPKSLLQNCHKIGEGVYGEVFLYKNPNGNTTVMKIIPIEGDQTVNGEHQKKFEEVLSEIIIAEELSNLGNSNNKNKTNSFIELQKIQCIQGSYPEQLLDLWELYDETRGSENDSPEMFKDDQLYIVLECNYGGIDMETFVFENAYQAYQMFQQVACAFAVAEEKLQFEHRDLHWGNILLKKVDEKQKAIFKVDGRDITIDTNGVQASIIDFTMSRIEVDNVTIFNDLQQDPEIFSADGDYQFEIYRLMQKKNGNQWQHFEPYTNVLWLHYVLEKAVTGLHYKKPKSKLHKQYLSKIKETKLDLLRYDSIKDFVNEYF